MATNRYITLSSSTGSISKRFKVIQMKPTWDPGDDIQRALDGSPDKSNGAIIATHQLMLRVRPTEDDTNYGTKDDLEALFKLRNPNGGPSTPTDKITYTDHFGTDHICFFLGGYSPDSVTTLLEGPSASYLIAITLGEVSPL